MREAEEEHEHVLDDPAPILSFEGFGENSFTLILRAYLSSIDYRITTITDLHKAINRKFAEAGIAIAFPQRDLHLNTTGPLQVELRHGREDSGDAGAGNAAGTQAEFYDEILEQLALRHDRPGVRCVPLTGPFVAADEAILNAARSQLLSV